ncbi:MAG: PAS domain S-box protein, partial [Desulfobulbaceae bacterium]|nr:PAS domain S-box protein [Desulfobulbaceae bacterium]
MKIGRKMWSRLGITGKFSLAFTLMLAFMMLIAATGYFSLQYIKKAEQKIRQSTKIEQLVLEMDRGLEKARRLHGDFFLQYQFIGLQAAHETYAQPSVHEIARVISQSNRLKTLLFNSKTSNLAEINQADVNLYLSSAKRFAKTSIEAVELVSQRAAPKRGLEAQLKAVSMSLGKELKPFPYLWSTHTQASLYYKEYLVSRQRYLMQSTLNVLNELRSSAALETKLASGKKSSIFNHIGAYEQLAVNLLDVDLTISGKLHDFSLQEQAVSPLSNRLKQLTQEEVELAENQIDYVHDMAGFIMLCIAILAAFALLYIARLMHTSVTKNVLTLTTAAEEFSRDNLDVRVQPNSQDELGQLGNIFNKMAARLKDLIENLEKKVEQRTAELSASEQRFRHLVNDLPKIAVQGYDSERKVIYWNRASERLYGYSAKEAMGKKLEELIIPDPMKDDIILTTQNCYENNFATPASEITRQNKDGSHVPVYSSHVMQTGYHGEKTMYSVDIDLADLKLAQEEGRKSEFFYRQLFAHSTSGIAVYEVIDNGRDFILRDLNKAGEKICWISRKESIGRRATELFPAFKEYNILDTFRKVWHTGEPDYTPASFYKDTRLEGWLSYRIYKLTSGEIVALFNDITKQKQAEEDKQDMELRLQRAQKMEAIGLLAGGVAHDLNNILSSIVGYPELLLLDLPQDSELRRPLEATKEAGERATAVVADLLTVARGIASPKEPRDLNVLIREYLQSPEFLKLQSNHPYVQFEQQLAPTLPAIMCSPIHIKKSIMNLVTNSAEAIEKSGTVSLATRCHTPAQSWAHKHGLEPINYVVLSISDTGGGIQEQDLDHIFEPFYTKKMMDNNSGTGLGLSIVWNAMQDHQGAVIVSRSDNTTIFDLHFPATEQTISAPNKPVRDMRLQGKGERILVVDDEPQQRNLARRMLERLGYEVTCQASGENALAYLQDHQVDLVLLDMLMAPGMNGRQTYEQMVELKPAQKAVIASGFSESDDVKAALNLGAGGF